MWFAASSLVAVLATVFVAAQPLTPEPLAEPLSGSRLAAPQTNAERFAIGLPPLPPKHRHRSGTPSGGKLPVPLITVFRSSKADTARRTMASPSLPLSTRCNILVKKATDGSALGYLTSPITRIYGKLQSSQEGALEFSFSASPSGPSSFSQLDILAVTPLGTSYPYLGGIASYPVYNQIGPGIFRYVFIGGTAQTPRGSPAIQVDNSYAAWTGLPSGSQSAIWKFDSVTQELTAQWVNPDGSLPPTYFAYDSGRLFLTGDPGVLYPALSMTVVAANLSCVTPVASQVSE